MGHLIKLVIALAVFGWLYNYAGLGEKSERDQLLDFAVRKINESAGQMVDNQTLLKRAYESSRGIVINYQLIDFQAVGFDRVTFNKKLVQHIKNKNCRKKEIKDILALDVAVNFVYFNATDTKIAEVILDKELCQGT